MFLSMTINYISCTYLYLHRFSMPLCCRRVVKEFMFWLFSDKLLYGEVIPGLGTYWLHREIQLVACRVSDGSKSAVERPECAITVESPAKSFIMWTKYDMCTIFTYLCAVFVLFLCFLCFSVVCFDGIYFTI